MVNVSSSHKLLMIALSLFSLSSLAETVTAWDLDHFQQQRVLYEAKAALNKAKAEAENKEYSGTGVTNTTVGNAQVASVVTSEALPQLVKINGKNAVIDMADGNTATVAAGQMLPGGRWQVISVGLSGVKVKNIATQRTQNIN
ncbi:type IV pilus biogenesis protein PilP [Salmonella enterica]|nr:type IV pilus biogenesis protein PilP [Salmonella enterica]